MSYLNPDEKALNIYTDGSSFSHPRKGGIGIRYIWYGLDFEEVRYDYEPYGFLGATNQQMELKACIESLKLLEKSGSPITITNFSKIDIFTDSMYLVNNYVNAMFKWPKNGWLTNDGNPVAHVELWKELIKVVHNTRKRVEIHWVKGHKKSIHNKAVDKLAKSSAQKQRKDRISNIRVRRKKSDKSVEIGSVKMLNQNITIRIITDEYLHYHKSYKYKYEVMSKTSNYNGNVDLIYSEIMLSAGHIYYVRLNGDQKSPRIIKKHREVIQKDKQ